MRCLADFILDSDLCLKPGAEPLTLSDPQGRFSLSLSNASEAEHAVPDAVLSAQLVFETGLSLTEAFREVQQVATNWLGYALNALTYATNRKFVPRSLKHLIDWTPGLVERDAMIYTETPEWDLAEPALDNGFIDTAERLLAMDSGGEHQAALRWYRIGIQEKVLEQQFSYFWFALEVVAEAIKGIERVPSKCPRCQSPLYCEQCRTHPTHRRYPGEAIHEVVCRVHPQGSDEVFQILQRIRHALMHGGRIADIRDLPCDDQQAVDKLAFVTWNAIGLTANQAGDPRRGTELNFGVPEHFARRVIVANVHIRVPLPGDPDNPRFADFPEFKFEAKYAPAQQASDGIAPPLR
jgi:hypothetical protein